MFSEVFSLFIEEGNKVKRVHKTKFRFATRHSPGQAITKIVLKSIYINHRLLPQRTPSALGSGERSENWSWPLAEMVSVIGEFKQGFLTFFRQTKASAKPARSARHAGRGKVFYSPVTRVWRVPLACSLPRRRSYGSVTRSCGAGKRDKPPGTSPREANSRVTSDDRCSTNERVSWEGFDCINWRNLRFNFYLFDDVCCSHSPLISIISWNISCSVMQEVLKVLL